MQHSEDHQAIRPWDSSHTTEPSEKILVTHDWDEIRRVMWDYVGIVRTNNRLKTCQKTITKLTQRSQ